MPALFNGFFFFSGAAFFLTAFFLTADFLAVFLAGAFFRAGLADFFVAIIVFINPNIPNSNRTSLTQLYRTQTVPSIYQSSLQLLIDHIDCN